MFVEKQFGPSEICLFGIFCSLAKSEIKDPIEKKTSYIRVSLALIFFFYFVKNFSMDIRSNRPFDPFLELVQFTKTT